MGEMETVSIELGFWDWIGKVVEKLTFARLNVADHREISEEDYALLKTLFRPYHNGEYQIFQSKMEGIVETVIQNSLFTDKTSEDIVNFDEARDIVLNGKDIDKYIPETIKEEEDE